MSVADFDMDELKARRRELQIPEDGHTGPAPSGRSLADRAGDEVETNDTALFPIGTMAGDPKVTFKGLIKPGRPVTVTASLTAAEVPIQDGQLLDPNKAVDILVTVVPKSAVLVYQRDDPGDDTVTSYKIRQPLKTAYVRDATSMLTVDQVEDLIRRALLQVGVTDSEKVGEIISELLPEA